MCPDRPRHDADKRGVVVSGETPKVRPQRCLTNWGKKKKIKEATETLSDTSVKTHSNVWRVASTPRNYNALGGWEVQRCGGGRGEGPAPPRQPACRAGKGEDDSVKAGGVADSFGGDAGEGAAGGRGAASPGGCLDDNTARGSVRIDVGGGHFDFYRPKTRR